MNRLVPLHCIAASLLAASLPAQTRTKKNIPPQYRMDYGPFLSATISGVENGNTALKGIAIKLGGGGGALFDTELLRVASLWTGEFLKLTGTAYDGAHGSWSSVAGDEILMTKAAPGWAKDGGFADPRKIAHGPLPRAHGRYRGLWLHGERVVVGYDVQGCRVLESYATASGSDGVKAIARTLNIGPSDRELRLRVCDTRAQGRMIASDRVRLVTHPPQPELVSTVRERRGWERIWFGGPSAADYADARAGRGVAVLVVDGFAKPAKETAEGKQLPRLLDGAASESRNDRKRCVWFDKGEARLLVDLRDRVDVHAVHTYSWHGSERAPQKYRLYGSHEVEAPATKTADPATGGWRLIASVDTTKLGAGSKHAVRVAPPNGTPLGSFRWLLLRCDPPSTNRKKRKNGTFLTEIDVWAGDFRSPTSTRTRQPRVCEVVALGDREGAEFSIEDGSRVVLTIPPRMKPWKLELLCWEGSRKLMEPFETLALARGREKVADLAPLTKGGPGRWKQTLTTKGRLGKGGGAWVVDSLAVPDKNPWHSRLRFGGFDFFADGRAALSTWNGDVWIVSGIDDKLEELIWRRFATGLFDPLGLKIVDGVIHTHGRDGIHRLHDLNGDGEADWYECFNNDVYVTTGFHEFAFDLHTDPEGNFVFAKGGPVNPGGRGFQKVTPHAGTVMKVSKDGQRLWVYATGLRAPNGIGVGPNGEVTSGDNEGTWTPRCRLNWIREGSFLGCKPTSQRQPPPQRYDEPLCWLPFEVDNSSGSQVWVTSDKWGPFAGELVHLTYGQCRIFKVLKETVDGQIQGGVTRFPLRFGSSCMRARFHPLDGQLYVCGFRGWQTRAARLTAFERVRYTKKPVYMPSELRVTKDGIRVSFACPLDPETANDPESFAVQQWNYLWSKNYGSPEVSVADPKKQQQKKSSFNKFVKKFTARDDVAVKSARLLADRKTVFLEIDGLRPVMQMEIKFNLDAADGRRVRGSIWNTIHRLGEAQGNGK